MRIQKINEVFECFYFSPSFCSTYTMIPLFYIFLTWVAGEMGSGPSASVLTFDRFVVSGLTVLLTAGSPLAFWNTDKNRGKV